jgi:hypothetical protein
MAFLLDSLRDKFGESDDGGFDDMHYMVGNTSGMDVGDVPTPIDQRIGRMAQLSGEIMEVQITNPATFEIDQPELINTINSLGLDIQLHSEPGIGFAAAYATRGQGFQGYNVVHRYFQRYLAQVARFKQAVADKDNVDFKIGRINPHASTENIPPLEERIASDVSLDPFGFDITEITGKKKNIYRNKEFLANLFDYFFLEQLDIPYQYYGLFAQFSETFEDDWKDARREVADEYWDQKEELQEKASLIQGAANVDRGLDTQYLDIFGDQELPDSIEIETEDEEQQIEMLEEAIGILGRIGDVNPREFQNPRQLSRAIYGLENSEVEEEWKESVKEALDEVLDELWEGNGDDYKISLEAKLSALERNDDVQQNDISEQAQDSVEEEAKKVFMGDEDYFGEQEDGSDDYYTTKGLQEEIPTNLAILKRLFEQGRFQQEIHKESSVYYNIIPAWMQVASESYENHEGWDAPEFIWEILIEENYDIDGYDDYRQHLADRQFRLDVVAAVAACYIWGHFTQVEDRFQVTELEEDADYTWVEWMAKYGIGVNIEAMHGGPGELLRLWRPKDISVACRAINMTAYDKMGHDIDPPAKFTIDMEHTASYGVDPWNEIEIFVEQEKELAKKGYSEADPDKPLADILKMYHLTKPGFESRQQSHRHGPFARGDKTLYTWLYRMIENGFCRNPDDPGIVMFEVGGEYREEMYVTRVAMDLIELGVTPEELDPADIPMNGDYENEKQALIARFFGIDEPSYDREWAKIEEHAFDPLEGLLEAEQFDYTFSSSAAIQNDNRPQEWQQEEYQ